MLGTKLILHVVVSDICCGFRHGRITGFEPKLLGIQKKKIKIKNCYIGNIDMRSRG